MLFEIPTRELVDVRVLTEGLGFPEGPSVLPDGSVAVAEVFGSRVTRVGLDGATDVISEVGGGPNGTAIGPDGALYVANNGGFQRSQTRIAPCIQRVDLTTGAHEVLYADCDGAPLIGPNDLVFDATGSMWFTDFYGGKIFYAAADGSSIVEAVSGLDTPNGIGLSPDGTTLYWTESHKRQVLRRTLSEPGVIVAAPPVVASSILNGRSPDPFTLLIGMPGGGELDSLAVDAGGAVCAGTLVEPGITVVSPDGSSVERRTLPPEVADGLVTNICFGGADLRTAYITASEHGRLLACPWDTPGLRLAF